MTDLGGGTWTYTLWIPGSTTMHPYMIYLQDTVGNWNMTSGAIQVIDTTPPTWTSVLESADPLELSGTEMITIGGLADLSGIQIILLAFEGANHTMTDLGGGNWTYTTWTPSSTGNYTYTIYIQDTVGNWNMTSGAIHVVDTTPPTCGSLMESADPLELGDTETITIVGVADLSGIQTVQIAIEGGNQTMTDLGGGNWTYTTWIPSSTGNYTYTIYIQDTAGNWNGVKGSIKVESAPPVPTFMLPLILLGAVITIGFFVWKRRTEL